MKITEPCNAPCGHCGGTGDEPEGDHSNDTLDAIAWALGARFTAAPLPDICCVCDGDGHGSFWIPHGYRHRPGEDLPRIGRPLTRGAIHREPAPLIFIIDSPHDLAREAPTLDQRERVAEFFKRSMLEKSIAFPATFPTASFDARKRTR